MHSSFHTGLLRCGRPIRAAAGIAAASLFATTGGAEPAAQALKVAVGFEQAYDTDVFRMDQGPLGDRGSAVTTLSAQVSGTLPCGIAASYAPMAAWYWSDSSEDNMRHVGTFSGKGEVAAANWEASTQTTYVDGSRQAPAFGLGHSCFTIAQGRERREQWQNRSSLAVRVDGPVGFVRAAGAFAGYDLRTVQSAAAGYDNYVDRYDIQGGVDAGCAGKGRPTFWLGYRHGYQFQDRDGGRPSDRSNHYDRLVFGVEGQLAPWLKIAVQAGPDYHHYASGSAGHRYLTRLFADASATLRVAPGDTVQLTTKHFQWVSSTGFASYNDVSCQTVWKHDFSQSISVTIGGKALAGLYDGIVRKDWIYAGTAGVTWRADAQWEWVFGYMHEIGHDASALNDPNREWRRDLTSIGLTWKY
ncbi:MAG: hypothetical protein PHQ04_01285 [Opitutaceae bacterium]|nr:hypothetical protein [Opitutaceae bacterium]